MVWVMDTIPDKIVTLHDFVLSELIAVNYITWRGVFIIDIFGNMKSVTGKHETHKPTLADTI